MASAEKKIKLADFNYVKFGMKVVKLETRREFQDDLAKLWDFEKVSLVTIYCRGRTFKANRVFLEHTSEYFTEILGKCDTCKNEEEGPSISLDFDPEVIHLCLRFQHCGRVQMPVTILQSVKATAKTLKIQQLYLKIQEYEIEDAGVITADNCMTGWCVSRKLYNTELFTKCSDFAFRNLRTVVTNGTISELCEACVKEYLSHPSLVTKTQDERLDAAIAWSLHPSHTTQLAGLLAKLPLVDCSPLLLGTLHKTSSVCEVPEVREIIEEAMKRQYEPPDAVECMLGLSAKYNADKSIGVISDVLAIPLALQVPMATMTKLPEESKPNNSVACVMYLSQLFVTGLGQFQMETYSYDIETGQWRQRAYLNYRRGWHAMAVLEGRMCVVGGRVPESEDTLVKQIEMSVNGDSWKVVGEVIGGKCYNTCCAVARDKLVIYGIIDDENKHQLLTYSLHQNLTQCLVKLYSAGIYDRNVVGLAVVDDKIIMFDANSARICPFIRQNDDKQVGNIYNYHLPNSESVIGMTPSGLNLLALGGRPRNNKDTSSVHWAATKEVQQLSTPSIYWRSYPPDKFTWSPGQCALFPGANSTGRIPLKKLVNEVTE